MQIRSKEVVLFIIMHNIRDKLLKTFLGIYILFFSVQSILRPYAHIPGTNSSLLDFITRYTNLIPFDTIFTAFQYYSNTGKMYYLYPLWYNSFVLIPIGFLVRRVYMIQGKRLVRFCIITVGILCAVYFLRILLKRGCFDIDDILLNVTGLCIGIAMDMLFQKIRGRKKVHAT